MLQINKNRVLLIVFLLIIIIAGSVQAGSKEIEDMNFKGADIRDVFRAISEVAEVNLVTDGSVKGNITIHLKSLSFQKALDLITQSHGLGYKWDGNTVVVATPQRIKTIYEKQNLKIIVLENNDLQRIKSIVNGIYPEINIQIDNRNEQLILVGSDDIIQKASNLIEDIRHQETVEGKTETDEGKDLREITEIVTIQYNNPQNILKNIKDIYSGLKLSINEKNAQIIMYGEKELVDKVKEFIAKLDIKETKDSELRGQDYEDEKEIIKFVKVNTQDMDSIIRNINNIYPVIKVSKNEVNQQLIIQGPESKVLQAEEIIANLDIDVDEREKEISEQQEKKYSETIDIKNGDMKSLKTELLAMDSGLEITIDNINEQLVISGLNRERVEKAVSLAKKWDKKQDLSTEVLRVDHVNIENIKSIVSNLHPDVSLHINKDVKEIIVKGKTETLDEVISLIDKLDVARRQVIIEARVEELSSSDLRDIGVNADNFTNIEFLKDSDDQITDLKLTWPQFLSALEREGTSETLANPHLMTLNGDEAKILIGERVPFEIANSEGETSIKYIDVGITLNFTPWITKNREIELEVKPEVSSLGEERANGYNVIQTREVETNIRLQDGETFAIGGLIQRDTIESMQKVPVLSEIPILGEIFRHRKKDLQKSELMIFITPRIVDNKVEEDKEEKIEIDKKSDEEKVEKDVKKKVSEDKVEKEEKEENIKVVQELNSKSDILLGNEVEKIINYSRRNRMYDTEDELPATLNLFYRIKEGETVEDIAARYGISPDSIINKNGLGAEFKTGDLITLPLPHSHLYRIKWGETLYKLAEKDDTNLETLRKINNISVETSIPGDFIIIFPKNIK